MKHLLIGLITLYKWTVSPLLPNACRYEPTCSHYAIEAIRRHGAMKGSRLATVRLLKCQPLCPGGYDPVR